MKLHNADIPKHERKWSSAVSILVCACLCFSLIWQNPFYLILKNNVFFDKQKLILFHSLLKNNVRKGCSITWDLTFEFWERLVFQRTNKQIIVAFNYFFLTLPGLFNLDFFAHWNVIASGKLHNLCCNYFDCTFAVKLTKLKIQFHIKVLGKLLHVNLVN
jgi:hypothetical protein